VEEEFFLLLFWRLNFLGNYLFLILLIWFLVIGFPPVKWWNTIMDTSRLRIGLWWVSTEEFGG